MPDLHGSRRTECSLHLSVASSHLVRSSVEEKRGKKKRGEPRKTIKLQYKMPASETCLDRDYLCRTEKTA